MGFEGLPVRPLIDPPDRREPWVRAVEWAVIAVPVVFLIIGLLLPK